MIPNMYCKFNCTLHFVCYLTCWYLSLNVNYIEIQLFHFFLQMVVCMSLLQPWINSNALEHQIQATSMLILIHTTEQYCILELNITTLLSELIKSLFIHRIQMFVTLFHQYIYINALWWNFHTIISRFRIVVIFDRFTQCTRIARQK